MLPPQTDALLAECGLACSWLSCLEADGFQKELITPGALGMRGVAVHVAEEGGRAVDTAGLLVGVVKKETLEHLL